MWKVPLTVAGKNFSTHKLGERTHSKGDSPAELHFLLRKVFVLNFLLKTLEKINKRSWCWFSFQQCCLSKEITVYIYTPSKRQWDLHISPCSHENRSEGNACGLKDSFAWDKTLVYFQQNDNVSTSTCNIRQEMEEFPLLHSGASVKTQHNNHISDHGSHFVGKHSSWWVWDENQKLLGMDWVRSISVQRDSWAEIGKRPRGRFGEKNNAKKMHSRLCGLWCRCLLHILSFIFAVLKPSLRKESLLKEKGKKKEEKGDDDNDDHQDWRGRRRWWVVTTASNANSSILIWVKREKKREFVQSPVQVEAPVCRVQNFWTTVPIRWFNVCSPGVTIIVIANLNFCQSQSQSQEIPMTARKTPSITGHLKFSIIFIGQGLKYNVDGVVLCFTLIATLREPSAPKCASVNFVFKFVNLKGQVPTLLTHWFEMYIGLPTLCNFLARKTPLHKKRLREDQDQKDKQTLLVDKIFWAFCQFCAGKSLKVWRSPLKIREHEIPGLKARGAHGNLRAPDNKRSLSESDANKIWVRKFLVERVYIAGSSALEVEAFEWHRNRGQGWGTSTPCCPEACFSCKFTGWIIFWPCIFCAWVFSRFCLQLWLFDGFRCWYGWVFFNSSV